MPSLLSPVAPPFARIAACVSVSVALRFAASSPVLAADVAALPTNHSRFPCPENEVARYTAYRADGPILVDGKLEEPTWSRAPKSPRFVDILSGGATRHDTHAMVVWDDENLYVAYQIEEPLVHAKFTRHNDPIYYDNDVEFFIAGRDAYYEFEINAFNTCYEVFFIWGDSYEKGGFSQAPEFARNKLQPFNGVGFKNHPRGGRLGQFSWSFPGKQTAVSIDGTVNKDDDRDRGWTVELAFPWKGLEWLAKAEERSLPPREGDEWRMDFSRFKSYKAAPPSKDSGGWVWTRHAVWDSHVPECFARIRFSTNSIASLAAGKPKE
ncbi:MAG: carbohydrate-binding family 9-like protein [Verrucomicrobia bacterium]|nr:carbohydrate-binding family 9-like protein [Verrucomicrobiota bacterium]